MKLQAIFASIVDSAPSLQSLFKGQKFIAGAKQVCVNCIGRVGNVAAVTTLLCFVVVSVYLCLGSVAYVGKPLFLFGVWRRESPT